MASKPNPAVEKKTLLDRFKFAFFSLLMAVCAAGIIWYQVGDIDFNLKMLAENAIAVKFSAWDFPIFLGLPTLIALSFGLLLRLFDKDSGKLFSRCLSFAIFFAVVAIVARVPSGFILSAYLEGKGYSPCIYFTSPANMSPQVWVRNSGYCIEQTSVVRKPLVDWIQALPHAGKGVTPLEVRNKAEALLEAYDKEQRELYPHLFDD